MMDTLQLMYQENAATQLTCIKVIHMHIHIYNRFHNLITKVGASSTCSCLRTAKPNPIASSLSLSNRMSLILFRDRVQTKKSVDDLDIRWISSLSNCIWSSWAWADRKWGMFFATRLSKILCLRDFEN